MLYSKVMVTFAYHVSHQVYYGDPGFALLVVPLTLGVHALFLRHHKLIC